LRRVSSSTWGRLFITRDTVIVEIPSLPATSFAVTRLETLLRLFLIIGCNLIHTCDLGTEIDPLTRLFPNIGIGTFTNSWEDRNTQTRTPHRNECDLLQRFIRTYRTFLQQPDEPVPFLLPLRNPFPLTL